MRGNYNPNLITYSMYSDIRPYLGLVYILGIDYLSHVVSETGEIIH